MFSILACKTKMNAPRCHTYLEIIYTRYGRTAHLVFMFFAFVTNILVGSQLLLGGSAVVTALTGMNVYAAVFLIRKSHSPNNNDPDLADLDEQPWEYAPT